MSLFSMPKPRRFCHKNIYADDRKQWLRQMEDRARNELAQSANDRAAMRERIHYSLTKNMSHLSRKQGLGYNGCLLTNIGLVAIIILVLLIAWRIILSI